MFDAKSRYARIPVATLTLPDGRVVAYVKRRFLPQGKDLPLLAEVPLQPGERLDQLSNRALGDPEASWRVADANDAMHPDELTQTPGRRLRVPLPEG